MSMSINPNTLFVGVSDNKEFIRFNKMTIFTFLVKVIQLEIIYIREVN